MGRKSEEEKITIIDRVGEKVDLNKCGLCEAHPDCFANVDGRCTALKKNACSSDCTFYATADEAFEAAKRSYQRLKEIGRTDLILANIKTLSALGVLDEEFELADQYTGEFEAFREQNYQEQLEAEMKKSEDADAEDSSEDAALTELFADIGDEISDNTAGDER